MLPFRRCWPAHRVLIAEESGLADRLGLRLGIEPLDPHDVLGSVGFGRVIPVPLGVVDPVQGRLPASIGVDFELGHGAA